MAAHYDIALVGAGRLNIGVFERLVDTLPADSAAGKRVVFIHNGPNLAGAPYDPDISISPLPLHQSIESVEAGENFIRWLQENSARVIAFIESQNDGSRDWLEHRNEAGTQTYREYLEAGEYTSGSLREMRLPRAVFGMYLADRLKAAEEKAHDLGMTVDFIQGNAEFASPIKDTSGNYQFTIPDGKEMAFTKDDGGFPTWEPKNNSTSTIEITATTASLGIGIMPNLAHPEEVENHPGYFRNLYSTGSTVRDIETAIRAKYIETNQTVPLLIEGAGPSAMDLINWIACQGDLRDKVIITIVSGHSRLRPPADEPKKLPEIFQVALHQENKTAAALQDWILAEINRALDQGFSRTEAVGTLFPHIIPQMKKMETEEQDNFREDFPGFYIGNLVFDAPETVKGWHDLVNAGKLTFSPGKYIDAQTAEILENGTISLEILGGENTEFLEFPLVVNCTGRPTRLNHKSHFIGPLLQENIAALNPAKTGLAVDAYFQAAPGLFAGSYLLRNSTALDGADILPGLEPIGPAVDSCATRIANSMVQIMTAITTAALAAHIATGHVHRL